MPRIRNPLWEYFTKSPDDPSKAQCNECSKFLSLGSSQPKKQTTGGLKVHLWGRHPEMYNNIRSVADPLSWPPMFPKTKNTISSGYAPKRQRKIKEEKIIPTNFVQPSKSSSFVSKAMQLWPEDHEITNRIDKCIMDLIIVDMLPFSIVESKAFRRFNFADPASLNRYEFKPEEYFREKLMPDTYDRVRTTIKKQLDENAEHISFTTDIWGTPTKSLISFTAHFIDKAVRRKVILGALVLEDGYIADYISEKLKEIIDNWGIQDKIHMAVGDAENTFSESPGSSFCSIGCMAHTLQLTIHEGIFSHNYVDEVVKKCRKIATHFQETEQATIYLNEFQKTWNIPEHTFTIDVDMRWNSTYAMLERIVEQRAAINLYASERGGIIPLSMNEWQLVQGIVTMLKPFNLCTLDMSSDDACVSSIIPSIAMIYKKMEKVADGNVFDMRNERNSLISSLTNRFNFLKYEPTLIAATLLDPRFKTRYLSPEQIAIGKDAILSFLNKTNSASFEFTDVKSSVRILDSGPSTSTEGFWDDHDDEEVIANVSIKNLSNFEISLNSYLCEPLLNSSTNIYQYWHASQYPILEPAARKYLSAPPTCVASEKLFSTACQLFEERGANLKGENMDKFLFLYYNIIMFDFNY